MNLMDRSDTYPSAFGNIREVVFEGYLQSSQMSDAERCTIIMLLDKLRPECAIEVGTAGGGSLSMIARYAKKAYSLDIDPTCRERFHSRFPNVEFIVGDSKETLPRLLRTLEASNEKLAFVLIDGLHTSEGVKADIENLLAYKPTCPLYVALHDSFNPECRSGMAAADWASSPFVHHVELDFVGGQFNRIETNGKPRSEIGACFVEAMLDAGYKIMAAAIALDQIRNDIAQLRDDAEQHQVRAWRSG